MVLYQYTTIDALSLILKNRTIRFTRLDTVDDPEEYGFEKYGLRVAPFVYVSCWTSVSEEIIPMWKMYSNNARGVRIGMDSQMFEVFDKQGWPSFFPEGYYVDKDFAVTPLTRNQQFMYPLYDVSYVEDVAAKTDSIYKDTNDGRAIDFKELGRYKKNDWSFQREKRFLLNVFPKEMGSDRYPVFASCINNQRFAQELFIDVPVKDSVFKSMEIVLGPLSTESDRVIISSLMNTYLNRIDFRISSFSGKMRF